MWIFATLYFRKFGRVTKCAKHWHVKIRVLQYSHCSIGTANVMETPSVQMLETQCNNRTVARVQDNHSAGHAQLSSTCWTYLVKVMQDLKIRAKLQEWFVSSYIGSFFQLVLVLLHFVHRLQCILHCYLHAKVSKCQFYHRHHYRR